MTTNTMDHPSWCDRIYDTDLPPGLELHKAVFRSEPGSPLVWEADLISITADAPRLVVAAGTGCLVVPATDAASLAGLLAALGHPGIAAAVTELATRIGDHQS
jgi:hypothetical protein